MKNGDYLLVKAPSNYTGKLYRTKYCYEHHLVYWKNTGIVLRDDEVIHHVDGDKHNNNFNNLELLKRSEHTKNHMLSRGKTFVLLKCPCCGIIFEREKGNHIYQKALNIHHVLKSVVAKYQIILVLYIL